MLLLLLLLLDGKVCVVQAVAPAVLTSCIAVLMIGPQGGGVVVIVVLKLGLGGGTGHRRARPGRSQGRVGGPRSGRQSRVRRGPVEPLFIDPRRDGRESLLGVVLRVLL